jgi:hypothetical protein
VSIAFGTILIRSQDGADQLAATVEQTKPMGRTVTAIQHKRTSVGGCWTVQVAPSHLEQARTLRRKAIDWAMRDEADVGRAEGVETVQMYGSDGWFSSRPLSVIVKLLDPSSHLFSFG